MRDPNEHRVVLIVDDEAFARLVATQILIDEGFIVLEAADSEQALRALEYNDDIALIFTDIAMPGEMNGLALASAVRALRPEIKLLITSGHSEPECGELPSGGRFLPKPYSSYNLLEAIRDITERDRATVTAAAA